MKIRWGTTRESFDVATMPQTALGSIKGPNDALHDVLRDISVTPRLHRLIDATLDGEGRSILLKCRESSAAIWILIDSKQFLMVATNY